MEKTDGQNPPKPKPRRRKKPNEGGAQAQLKESESSVQKKQSQQGRKGNEEGDSFSWFPEKYAKWQNTELMNFIKKSPEHYGKLEQELKSLADVQIRNSEVIVSPNGKGDWQNWKGECRKRLENYFKDFSVQSLSINKELKQICDTKGPNVEVKKQGVNGDCLIVSVTGCAKDVEKKMFELKEKNKVQSPEKNAAAENQSSQSVRRKQKNRPPSPMRSNSRNSNVKKNDEVAVSSTSHQGQRKQKNQPQSSTRPKSRSSNYRNNNAAPRYHSTSAINSQKTSILPTPPIPPTFNAPPAGYQPRQLMPLLPTRRFFRPPVPPDYAVFPISIEQRHLMRFTEEMLQEIRSTTSVEIIRQSAFLLELRGLRTEVENARRIINENVCHRETRTILCQQWIFDELYSEIQEAREHYPELEIRFDGYTIVMTGHPTECDPVHNRLNEKVKEFLEVYLDVPKRHYGLIIGKKGQKIDALQSKYKVEITIPTADKSNSKVRIRGKTADVKNAEAEIKSFVQQVCHKATRTIFCQQWIFDELYSEIQEARGHYPELEIWYDGNNTVITGHPTKCDPVHNRLNEKVKEFLESYLDVPKQCHRMIIGKKGQKIDALKSKFQVEITIPPADTSESKVRIRGRTANVKNAKAEITSFVQQVCHKATRTIFCQQWIFDELYYEIQETRRYYPELEIRFDRNNIVITGHPTECDPVHNRLNEKVKEFLESYLDVPKQCHRMIIGKKGQKIDVLKSKFQVAIFIPPADTSESKVRIRGKTANVKNAEAEITSFVRQVEQPVIKKTVNFPSRLYSQLQTHVWEEKEKWKEVNIEIFDDKIILSGSKSMVETLYESLRLKVLDLSATGFLECITTEKEHGQLASEDGMASGNGQANRVQQDYIELKRMPRERRGRSNKGNSTEKEHGQLLPEDRRASRNEQANRVKKNTKTINVQSWLTKYVKKGARIHQIKQQFPEVEINMDKNKVKLSGPTEFVENAFLHFQQRIEELTNTHKMVSIPMEGNQMLGLIGYQHRNLKKLSEDFEVNMNYTTNKIELFVDGYVEKVEIAHVHVVEKIQELYTYCILETHVPPDQMGRFIGKGGATINYLKNMYSEINDIITPRRDQPQDNVLLMGDRSSVDNLQRNLSSRFNAVKIRYRELPNSSHRDRRGSRYSSTGNLSMKPQTSYDAGSLASMRDFDEEFVDSDDTEQSSTNTESEEEIAVFYVWPKEFENALNGKTVLLKFVAESKVHVKRLKENFESYESVIFSKNEGKFQVAGRSTPSAKERWVNETRLKFERFFKEFASFAIEFHERSSVDRSDCFEENVCVLWNERKSIVVITGLKERAGELYMEYMNAKERTKAVSVTVSGVHEYIIRYVKESTTEFTKFQDMFSGGSISDSIVEMTHEIPEIDSEEEWRQEWEQNIVSFFAQYEFREIQVPFLHSGEMRTHSDEHERLIVCWDSVKSSLMIYGMKPEVDAKARELAIKLERIKNEKVKVSYEYYVEDLNIFRFIMDRHSHIEKLVEKLGELGSPVFNNQKLTVNSEILKTSPVHEWEEKCENIVRQFLDGYKSKKIAVSDERSQRAQRLTSKRQSVITKWIATENCLLVCGDRVAVDAMVKLLHEQLQEEEEIIPPDSDTSSVSVIKEIEVKIYGAYEFLNEQIGFIDMSYGIRNNCEISVERMVDEMYGDSRFVCIPSVDEDDDRPQTVFGNLTVTVEENDITEVLVDAIVNTTDKSFSFHGPLSKTVLSKGGIQEYECLHCGTNMKISRGGNLKCSKIIHVAIPSQHESMSAFVTEILKKAEELRFSSVALPAIGAGGGGWNCSDVANGIRDGISNFVATNINYNHLQTIKIVLFNEMREHEKRPFYYILHGGEGQVSQSDVVPQQNVFHYLISGINNMFRSLATPREIQSNKEICVGAEGLDNNSNNMERGVGKFAKIKISSDKKENVETAKKEVDKFVKLHLKECSLNDSLISRLKKDQIKDILRIAIDEKIRIIINRKKDVHEIRMQGLSERVTTAQKSIEKFVSEISKDFPETWDPMPGNQTVLRVVLSPTSSEYLSVERKFVEANKDLNTHFSITKIERLQNKELYRHYAIKKESVASNAQTVLFERQLFHGTNCETIDLICKHGFDKCYAGKNATMYGNGTYFSTQSSYSSVYTATASYYDTTRQMFLASVLTGDFCQGYQGLPAPPQNVATGLPYDSVVDALANPSMFIVFKDSSTYPSYIISYTK